MWRYVFCSLTFLLPAVVSSPVEYEITNYCDDTILVRSSVILTLSGWYRTPDNQHCTVTVRANHASRNNLVRLQLLHFPAACSSNSMLLYDGGSSVSQKRIAELCSNVTEGRMFMTVTDTLTMVLITQESLGSTFTARLLATSTSRWYGSKSDFICDNQLIVDPHLRCDGYNNCGDESDESSDACASSLLSVRDSSIMMGVFIFCFIVFVVVASVLVRRLRQSS